MSGNSLIRNATRRQLAERLQAVLDSSLDAIVTMDAAGVVAGWNPAAETLFGWTGAEAAGRSLGDLIVPPEHREAHRRGIERLMATGEARLIGRRVEVVALRRDGSVVDVELTLARIGASADETLFVAHVRDISERRNAERERGVRLAEVSAELRRSEARRAESEQLFRVAFRSAPVSLSVVDMESGRFVEANDTFYEWTGLTRDQVIGKTTRDLEVWADLADRDAFLREIATRGFIRNRECRFRKPGGGTTMFLVSAERIEIGGAPHIFSAGLNIDTLKQAENDLRNALEQEQELRRLKSRFVSLVSHEYRTPLGVIRSSAEILEAYFDRLAPARRLLHLGDIKDAATTMTRLMDEVLFLERTDSGKLGCRPAPMDLALFCSEFLRAAGIAEHAGRVRFEAAVGMPDAWIDAGLLRLALGNLLGNAFKYSRPDMPVEFHVRRDGDTAVVSVGDQGIGIPAADIPRLFEPFHRAGNVGETPGSGLGLVIVKKCADLHGGRVSVESDEGRGTTFELRLPVFREPASS